MQTHIHTYDYGTRAATDQTGWHTNHLPGVVVRHDGMDNAKRGKIKKIGKQIRCDDNDCFFGYVANGI